MESRWLPEALDRCILRFLVPSLEPLMESRKDGLRSCKSVKGAEQVHADNDTHYGMRAEGECATRNECIRIPSD
eukprot:12575176-Alexandrium_andersonii.AAC.1